MHLLIPHGRDVLADLPETLDYFTVGDYLRSRDIEGIVWWDWDLSRPIREDQSQGFWNFTEMIWLIILVAVLIFGRSLHGEFLFDDPAIEDFDYPLRQEFYQGRFTYSFLYDKSLETRKPCGGVVVRRQWPTVNALLYFFREPRELTHMGYLWTWKAFRFTPAAWHAVNLALHAANILLVYLLLANSQGRLMAAAIFAVHPLQASAVCYISGRAVLQMSFFVLTALIFFSWGWLWWALASVILAWKSKEDGPLWALLLAGLLRCSGAI